MSIFIVHKNGFQFMYNVRQLPQVKQIADKCNSTVWKFDEIENAELI